jgi:hypothetical protein
MNNIDIYLEVVKYCDICDIISLSRSNKLYNTWYKFHKIYIFRNIVKRKGKCFFLSNSTTYKNIDLFDQVVDNNNINKIIIDYDFDHLCYPLIYSIIYGNIEIIIKLLKMGAKSCPVNTKSDYFIGYPEEYSKFSNTSPLDLALMQKKEGIVKTLLDFGFHLSCNNQTDRNTIDINYKISKEITKRIENLHDLDSDFMEKNDIEINGQELVVKLLKLGANPNMQYEMDDTPIMYQTSLENVKIFVEYGANVNASNSFGYSVLDCFYDRNENIDNDNIINFLISNGAKRKRRRYVEDDDYNNFWNDHNHLGYKHGDWIN